LSIHRPIHAIYNTDTLFVWYQDKQEPNIPPKQVAVPAPDPALPPSFDGASNAHRYRFLEPTSQWMVRPIVEAHGWDHESGVEGFSVDKVRDCISQIIDDCFADCPE
jgi:hypothetical protein